ncbi:MAG: DnaJ domain-containing protein [Scytolyngbya sp. HA4215-MV1]|nr:DnaJ domain-containing protein [Scytolyngbya sp. HA4215-MV1]
MSPGTLPQDWLTKFTDPYALLGVSVAADDRRILKRYRNIAKLLHPDSYVASDAALGEFASTSETSLGEFASQLFARLVNPAYQKIKQEKGRAETSAILRHQVRRLNRDTRMVPTTEIARKLLQEQGKADVFYEQAVSDLAESQYQPLEQFEIVTQQLCELNLVYLQLKMGDIFIREKRTGLVSAEEAKPIQFTPVKKNPDQQVENYAQRHYNRAQEYMKKANWQQAIQELRDAIKIEADKSEYHAMLGLVYYAQSMKGMATVYFRQALKLNPKEPLACKYAKELGLQTDATDDRSKKPEPKRSGLFGLFGTKQK